MTHNIQSFNTAASGVASVLPLCAALAFYLLWASCFMLSPLLQRNRKLALKHPERDHSLSLLLLFALSWSTNTFTKTFQATPSPPASQTFLPFPERGLGTREGRGRREPNKDGLTGVPPSEVRDHCWLRGPNKKHRIKRLLAVVMTVTSAQSTYNNMNKNARNEVSLG